jgi:DNA-binding winged helix-turn-helix (wHTH) protein
MVYRFGACLLNTQEPRMQRADQRLWVCAKVWQVLLYIVKHRHRTVLKQELCAQVWPQSFISGATLESTVRAARRAIGDSGRAQQMIRTVYGSGYQFIMPVEEGADLAAATAAPSPPSSSGAVPTPDGSPSTPRVSGRPMSPGEDANSAVPAVRDEGMPMPPSRQEGTALTLTDAMASSPAWEQKSVAVLAMQ